MKIDQNSRISGSESAASQTELQNQSVKTSDTSVQNAAPFKESETMNVGRQKLAAETMGSSNLTAGLLQKSLTNAVPSRSELLKNTAKELLPKLPEMLIKSGKDPDNFLSNLRAEIGSMNYKVLGSMPDQDIMAIAFIVLMNASKSAQEDLKAIMESVKHINKSKEELRDLMNAANKQAASTIRKKDDDD